MNKYTVEFFQSLVNLFHKYNRICYINLSSSYDAFAELIVTDEEESLDKWEGEYSVMEIVKLDARTTLKVVSTLTGKEYLFYNG